MYDALSVQLGVWPAVGARGLSGGVCPLQAPVTYSLDRLCPGCQLQATCGYRAPLTWLVHTEMHLRHKIHTEF